MTLGIAPKRAKPRWFGVLAVVTGITLLSAGIALAGPVGIAGGFEDDDANLVDSATTAGIDWNTFQDVSWLPANSATPTRQADKIANGFKFKEHSGDVLAQVARRATRLYHNRDAWRSLMRNGMAADHSWAGPAREYVKVYRRARAEGADRARQSSAGSSRG